MEITSIDPSKLSNAIRQYYEIKMKHLDKVIFFQMGDFFEMFFDDALYMAKVCDLALTQKAAGLDEKIPMAGIPLASVNDYVKMVLNDHKKVVIVEQGEMSENNVMQRNITKIFTPANFIDDIGQHKYVGCCYYQNSMYFYSFGDLTTGSLYHLTTDDASLLANEINNNNVVELINLNASLPQQILASFDHEVISKRVDAAHITLEVCDQVLIDYIKELNCDHVSYLTDFETINLKQYLQLTPTTMRSLELTASMQGDEQYSLYGYLNTCDTAMGRRYLKTTITHPLLSVEQINQRLDLVEYLFNNQRLILQLKELLHGIYDIERILIQISDRSIGVKGVVQLRTSLKLIKRLIKIIEHESEPFNHLCSNVVDPQPLIDYLDVHIMAEPNMSIKDGMVINHGVNSELDELRNINVNSSQWLADYEAKQRELCDCKNLKIKYNRIAGYFIEIPNGSIDKALPTYEETQKLVNARRYITPELREMDDKINSASEKIYQLEQHLFGQIKIYLETMINMIRNNCHFVEQVDFLTTLANASLKGGFVRPTFNHHQHINIKGGFHPVIKSLVNDYIVNDTIFNQAQTTLLITGPNMSGKSTYMRQTAIIIILAQMGCFVPATSADLMIVDQIFTRIGASDDTQKGQSTFMVEMQESSEALLKATSSSLVLFDELGRGTSTYDGMSLAASILEHITTTIKCPTMFSTHYHELISLEETYPTIHNVHVSAQEHNNELIFLHKVVDGGVANSYGIEVARLANLPQSVLQRAKQYLAYFSSQETIDQKQVNDQKVDDQPNKLLYDLIKKIDMDNITPRQAFDLLEQLQRQLKEEHEN